MTVSVKFDRLSPLDKKNALAFIGGETAACRNFLSDSERSIPLFEKKMKKNLQFRKVRLCKIQTSKTLNNFFYYRCQLRWFLQV